MVMKFGSQSAPVQSEETFSGERESLAGAVRTMARLRAPNGCPWDLEQTFDSLQKHTLEETYEVFDAIERRDWGDLRDELGDMLLQVLFYAQIAADAGYFTIADVAASLTAKLERRHPHIFPDAEGKLIDAADADAVNRNWERIKREEKAATRPPHLKTATAPAVENEPEPVSLLDDVSRAMPATMEAEKLGSRAARVGFDWPDASGLFAKMDEELAELMVEVEAGAEERVHEECGDLLFTAANLVRHLHLNAETVLRAANAKFRRRFRFMEQMGGGAELLQQMDIGELEELWKRAKQISEFPTPPGEPIG